MHEAIISQGVCNRIKGAFVENGHAMLTNQRFIYSKHSFAKIAVMGALVNLTKGDFDFDIPIAGCRTGLCFSSSIIGWGCMVPGADFWKSFACQLPFGNPYHCRSRWQNLKVAVWPDAFLCPAVLV